MLAKRGCGAAAFPVVIISFLFDFVMLAVSSSLTSDVLTRSLCKFLLVEPIFCGLWLC